VKKACLNFYRIIKADLIACFLFIFAIGFSSCSKKTELVFTEISSGSTRDMNSIFFLDDSMGFACGGLRYEQGEVLKTTDGGLTWKDESSPEMIKALYRITFPVKDTGFTCGYDGKIFRTVDGGNNWTLYQTPLYRPLHDIFMWNTYRGFVCGGDGFRSGCHFNTSDDGNTWNGDTSDLEFRSVIFLNDTVGLMAGYGAILRSTDAGKNWIYTNAKQDFFVSMSFVNNETGFAAGYTGSILKTNDAGQTWETLRNANSLFEPSWFFNQVIFRDANVGYIAGDGGCFLKTEDGGNHWLQVKNAPEIDFKGMALTKNGGFLCGSEGKIFHFLD
jgi:photosystem II stability/assembly factor-like uncharacterized protein